MCNLVATAQRRAGGSVPGGAAEADRAGWQSSARMQPTTIAVDGGLFEHYQAYRGYLRTNLDQLLGRQVSCASALAITASSPLASLWPDHWCTWAASSSNVQTSLLECQM